MFGSGWDGDVYEGGFEDVWECDLCGDDTVSAADTDVGEVEAGDEYVLELTESAIGSPSSSGDSVSSGSSTPPPPSSPSASARKCALTWAGGGESQRLTWVIVC